LSEGLRDLGGNSTVRKAAIEKIQQGTELYDELAKQTGRIPLLHQEALWGAAKGYEALGGTDNLDKARAKYEQLRKEYESTALGKDARKQLDRLNSDSTRQDLRDISRAFAVSARD
jgi:hypothetical protein